MTGHPGSTASTRAPTPAQYLLPAQQEPLILGSPAPAELHIHIPSCTLTSQANPAPSSCSKGPCVPMARPILPRDKNLHLSFPSIARLCFPLQRSGVAPQGLPAATTTKSCSRDSQAPQLHKQLFAKMGQRQNTPAAHAAAGPA